MKPAPFDLLQAERPGPVADPDLLNTRAFAARDVSFAGEAALFEPGLPLATAINAALAVGEPLLITGEPGTGKTQAAYYAAWKLGLGEVIHFQVKSDSTARDLLYHFDSVRYFHSAQAPASAGWKTKSPTLAKADFVEPRALWLAFRHAEKHGRPAVLLIDEIDKAPRDFPNDLLHELDKMEFKVLETGETVRAERRRRPVVFITSNSERRLPEPFLRRCVYHHIVFDETLVRRAVEKREGQFPGLNEGLIDLAVKRFLALRQKSLRKRPATGEFLVWLRVLSAALGTQPKELEKRLEDAGADLAQLPYLGVLLKDRTDLEQVGPGPLPS